MWRYLLLALGCLTVTLLIWHIGPEKIYTAAARVGPGAVLIILIPSFLMYVFEAYGWKLTLGSAGNGIPFRKIFAIRTAGEVVNMTTPTAYVGGEPLKAYLLQRQQIPMVEGLASVVIAKTIMTLAQVLFILVGIALAFWMLVIPRNPASFMPCRNASSFCSRAGSGISFRTSDWAPSFSAPVGSP